MINLRALALPVGLCLIAAACGSSSTGGAAGAGGKSGAGGAGGAGGASAASCLPTLPSTGTCTQAELTTYGGCFVTQCAALQACYTTGGGCADGCTSACTACVTTAATGCLNVCPPPACIAGGAGGAGGGGTCLAQVADCCAHATGAAMIAMCGMDYQDLLANGDLAETACGVKLAGLKNTYCPQ